MTKEILGDCGPQNEINEYLEYIYENFKIDEISKYDFKLFDGNTYPIIVINDINNSGDYQIAQLLLNIISPLFSFNIYGAIKIKNDLKITLDHITNEILKYKLIY